MLRNMGLHYKHYTASPSPLLWAAALPCSCGLNGPGRVVLGLLLNVGLSSAALCWT